MTRWHLLLAVHVRHALQHHLLLHGLDLPLLASDEEWRRALVCCQIDVRVVLKERTHGLDLPVCKVAQELLRAQVSQVLVAKKKY